MKIITSLENIEIESYGTGIALGNFDGVHIGHQALIVNLVDVCKKNNLKSIVYTFHNHPKQLTSTHGGPKRIMDDEKKLEIFKELGVDYIVLVEFDEYQRKLDPEQFVKEILKDKLKMVYCVVGFDYHFGYKAMGNTNLLEELKHKYNYGLMIIKALKIQEEVISSTKIRQLIANGDLGKANLFLGRNYSIKGKVVHGKAIGRKFGFPTANILFNGDLIIPSPGVYFTKCIINNKIYYSVTNIGFNPTVGTNPMGIETHIIGFDDNIYDEDIEIIFYLKSRNEIKYSNVDDLIKQVHKDIQLAKIFFDI